MLKRFLQTVQWLNVGSALLGILTNLVNQWTQIFPTWQMPHGILQFQILLAGVLQGVSVAGYSTHRLLTGEAQMPADRTAAEVVSASIVTATALKEAAPVGANVAVPSTVLAIAPSTKEGP